MNQTFSWHKNSHESWNAVHFHILLLKTKYWQFILRQAINKKTHIDKICDRMHFIALLCKLILNAWMYILSQCMHVMVLVWCLAGLCSRHHGFRMVLRAVWKRLREGRTSVEGGWCQRSPWCCYESRSSLLSGSLPWTSSRQGKSLHAAVQFYKHQGWLKNIDF